ncbi:MAG: hypothetical protein NW203_06425 [Hyphomonadaceae bacterium]|nr:hypothetical protein [Hyphomonadaceae bacterium]
MMQALELLDDENGYCCTEDVAEAVALMLVSTLHGNGPAVQNALLNQIVAATNFYMKQLPVAKMSVQQAIAEGAQ